MKKFPAQKIVDYLVAIGENGKNEDSAIRRITFILGELDKHLARSLSAKLVDALRFDLRKPFAARLLLEKTLYPEYLHSLCSIGYYGLGGTVVLDQLARTTENRTTFEEYITSITPAAASSILDPALELLNLDTQKRREFLQQMPIFPFNYLEKSNIQNLLTSTRITNLVFAVCEFKKIAIPEPFRISRLNYFFTFLINRFKQNRVNDSDFAAMVREASLRLDFDLTMAVNFFISRIPLLATVLASEANIPVPVAAGASDETVPFKNPPCPPEHRALQHLIHDVRQAIVYNERTLDLFKNTLASSSFIVIAHHEPPAELPGAERIDMLSVRTSSHCFHVLSTPTPDLFQSFINTLRCFAARGVLYARHPQGLQRILVDRFAWNPVIVDIHLLVDKKVGKKNSSFTELSRHLTNSPFCWSGSTFSAHIRPSKTALLHRDLYVSVIYAFVCRNIDELRELVQQQQADEGAAAAREEEQEKEEETRRIADEEARRIEEEEEARRIELQEREEELLRRREEHARRRRATEEQMALLAEEEEEMERQALSLRSEQEASPARPSGKRGRSPSRRRVTVDADPAPSSRAATASQDRKSSTSSSRTGAESKRRK